MRELAELEGIWLVQGYNWVLKVGSGKITAYDISSVSCVEMDLPMLKWVDRIERHGKERASLYVQGGITRYPLVKLSALPESCKCVDAHMAHDPVLNFESFWHAVKENYAFFERRNVDWDHVYQIFRPRVTGTMTNDELFDTFRAMIELFGDRHIELEAGDRYAGGSVRSPLLAQWSEEFDTSDPEVLLVKGHARLSSIIVDGFLGGVAKTAASDMLIWGKIEPNIGYLHVFAMTYFAGLKASVPEHLVVLGNAMDQAMEDFQQADAVVVDVRFNPGGEDAAALLIANRFADRRRMAFTKRATGGGVELEPQAVYVLPEGSLQFTGPVYLLTSRETFSAAEIFTLCMMTFPHVTVVGTRTQGALSDQILRQLPNGWKLKLSGEVYEAADGHVYEQSGIPPQVEVETFFPARFYDGLRDAVDKAVSMAHDRLVSKGGEIRTRIEGDDHSAVASKAP